MDYRLNPYYAVVPLSLEPLFIEELKKLGIEKARAEKGGCWFGATDEEMMRVNLHTRTASRILRKIAEKSYRDENDIYELAKGVAWENFFETKDSFRVDITAHRSPLRSLDFTALKIKDAVCDRFVDREGVRPDVDRYHPRIRIYAFVNEKSCTLYLDTSGESLFKRGWRKDKGEAPLKENLAAGLLGLAAWDQKTPLYDPFCGSGTIIIEAATIACNMAPGLYRRFGFENFRNFDSDLWQQIKKEARMAIDWNKDVVLAGSDISTLIVDRAQANARLAGLAPWLESGKVRFFAQDARTVRPISESAGLIVTNPPYGEQSNPKSASVASMMKNVADNLKQHFDGWTAWFLTSDRGLPRQMRLSEERKIVFFNGPLECRFFKFTIKAGSFRKERPESEIKVNKEESEE
jgi:putative N6-adenine-specific DNA methylase